MKMLVISQILCWIVNDTALFVAKIILLPVEVFDHVISKDGQTPLIRVLKQQLLPFLQPNFLSFPFHIYELEISILFLLNDWFLKILLSLASVEQLVKCVVRQLAVHLSLRNCILIPHFSDIGRHLHLKV